MKEDPRLQQILNLVYNLAAGDLLARCDLNSSGDDLDAIIGGLNMLAEELSALDESNKKATEKLKIEKRSLQTLLEQIPLGIITVDSNGALQYINSKFVDLFGYSFQEASTFHLWIQEALVDKNEQKMFLKLWENILTDRPSTVPHQQAFIIKTKDGSVKEIEINIFKLKEGNFCITHKDITETVLMERRLLQAKKMEAVGTLAGGVAHDLNNILSGIVSYPELLLMGLPENSDLRKPLQTIRSTGLKAAAIVKDLLAMARKSSADMQVMSLTDIISDYLKSPEHHKMLSYHQMVEVVIKQRPHLLNIKGSSIQITKLIMNTVFNAAEAMPYGGTITLELQNSYLSRNIPGKENAVEGEYVVYSISDTGTGIKQEDIDHIFEPFYTTKKLGRSGTGLGMAVIYSIVMDHHGYIDVESVENKGTTITIYFPATREEMPSAGTPAIDLDTIMGNHEKILIVDDIAEQREICSAILQKIGYQPVTVTGGEEALHYLQKNRVELVIIDMIMEPGIDGVETYRRIREMIPEQKAIVASGFSSSKKIREAKFLGIKQFVYKPYSIQTLGYAIARQLRVDESLQE